MKTNANSIAKLPAVAYVDTNCVSLSVVDKGTHHFIHKPYEYDTSKQCIRCEIFNQLAEFSISRQHKLVIILASELTLYSYQQFPAGLSEYEIQHLIELQRHSGPDLDELNTFFDFFELKHDSAHSVYGVFEANKPFLMQLMHQFETLKCTTVGVLPQSIVLINYLLIKHPKQTQTCALVLLLSERLYFASLSNHKVETLEEHAIVSSSTAELTIQTLIDDFFMQISTHASRMILSWNKSFDFAGSDDRSQVLLIAEHDPAGHFIIDWLKHNYDYYKSAGLA